MAKEKEDVDVEEKDDDIEEEKVDDKSDDKSSGGKDDKPDDEEKMIPQSKVTAIATKEKKEGFKKYVKETYGITDPKVIDRIFKQGMAIEDANKTDDERAAEENSKTQEAIKAAEDKALSAQMEAAALKLSAKPEYVEDIVVLAKARMDEGSEPKTVIAEVKAKYASFFEDDSIQDDDKDDKKDDKDDKTKDDKSKAGKKKESSKKKGEKGTGGEVSKDDIDGDDEPDSLGARLAKKSKSSKPKKSYW